MVQGKGAELLGQEVQRRLERSVPTSILQSSGTHTHADGNAHAYTDSYANTDSHGHTHADAHAYTDSHASTHG